MNISILLIYIMSDFNKNNKYTYFKMIQYCKNNSDLDLFENDILQLFDNNQISNLKIMEAYTFIYNNKFIKSKTCFKFRNIYKKIIKMLLQQIIILNDTDLSIFRRSIQLQLHKYYKKKKYIDKIFFNFNYCSCNQCLSTIGTISNIHDNLFQKYFQHIPSSFLVYDHKKIKEYIQNCKNSLLLKSKIINDNEFFKRNIFCYF